jgi:hypothetical protein
MMVELDNDMRFLANFRYEIKANATRGRALRELTSRELSTLIPNTEASSKAHFSSVCDATMVGFVQNTKDESSMENMPVTCFFAEKESSPEDLV